MTRVEKSLVGWFTRNVLFIGLLLMVFVSVVARFKLLPFRTNDMNSFLLPWVQMLREGGLAALGEGVGNYNILYLLVLHFIGMVTSTEQMAIYGIKLVSMIFDYAMAAGVALIVYHAREKGSAESRQRWALLGFAAATLFPLVMLNSALWGQCDSIYSCFGVWAVYGLMREKWIFAFVMFGLGLCFKLQIVFLLPVFVLLYFVQKKFSLWQFLIPPVLLFLASLPAVFNGAELFIGFKIYLGQTEEYESIFVDYPGFSALIQDDRYEYFSMSLILLTMLVLFAMLAWLLRRRLAVQGLDVAALSVWCICACLLFLPSMHERYGYMAEVLLCAVAIAKPTKQTIFTALVFTFTGYCAYAGFLFDFLPVPFQYTALMNFAVFAWFTAALLRGLPQKPLKPQPIQDADLVAEPGRAISGTAEL